MTAVDHAELKRLEERLSEIAALFGVPDGGRYLNDWKARALAAERDRDALQARLDKAEGLLRRIDRKYADMQDGNGNHPTELRKVRAFLASKETNNG